MLAIVPWPICIAAFKIVSCHTLRWWCGPQAGPNARHHNYSQILRVFPKNLLTIPAVLCDNRIIEQLPNRKNLWQHRTIPALRLKHRSGGYGTASALPKCSIMSGCGTRIVLRGQKPLALCDRCPCFGSLSPPLAALTFAASSIICAFGLAAAAPRSPYRHLELCGIALTSTFTAQCGNLHCGLPRQKHGKALPHRCPSCQCRQRRALRPAPSHWCGRSRAAP